MLLATSSRSTLCTVKKTLEIAAAAKAQVVVQLKDNQPTLRQAAEIQCRRAKPLSTAQTVDRKKRNRRETRTVAVFNAKPVVAGTEWQPHIAAIIQVERCVNSFKPATGLWKTSTEISLYLSTQIMTADLAADIVRGHWSIENRLHYTRDVTLREDASRIRKNPGIFARLRSFAYNLLRANQSDTIPQDRYAAALGGIDALTALIAYKEN